MSLLLLRIKKNRIKMTTTLNIDFSNTQSKYEEDPIKIEGARVATTQNNDFSNT